MAHSARDRPGDDGIDLDFDTSVSAPSDNLEDAIYMGSTTILSPPQLDVRVVVEAIAGNRHDVQVLPIGVEPFFGHLGAVVHDGTRLEVKLFLAVPEEFANVVWLKKGLASADVQFLHSGLCQQAEPLLRIIEGEYIQIFRGVKTKFARIIAFPMVTSTTSVRECGTGGWNRALHGTYEGNNSQRAV